MDLEHQPAFCLFCIYLGEHTLTFKRDGFGHWPKDRGFLFAGRNPRFCDTDSTIVACGGAHDLGTYGNAPSLT
jgi:hypothetical protein